IQDNKGGMLSPHMFLVWFALTRLKPKSIIESGVWLGQGTWLFEKACPYAELHCIDPFLNRIQYKSTRAKYYVRDFSTIDWNDLPKDETLCFFDDHQNAYERIKTARWFGFKHLIFEDNYPAGKGDCYSLKKVFMRSGFAKPSEQPSSLRDRAKQKLRKILGHVERDFVSVPPNEIDAKYLKQNLEIYYEFPPVFKAGTTRWGENWDDNIYPTPEPLLYAVEHPYQQRFKDEAQSYTWICYAKLREKTGLSML
ncbi:MAG: hypothetical protein ACRD4B_05320, partial [Acidobacteriota bacterium]